uniref:Uncharacterized protein TCIL3000_10_14000 n=1 Tax=Trypanosoma congolense (strain IL3000) TaxID=1068625 RepID=G0UYZ6_TRYCI|nr:unnamed protein product [Trypanosoma congolense IL3000]
MPSDDIKSAAQRPNPAVSGNGSKDVQKRLADTRRKDVTPNKKLSQSPRQGRTGDRRVSLLLDNSPSPATQQNMSHNSAMRLEHDTYFWYNIFDLLHTMYHKDVPSNLESVEGVLENSSHEWTAERSVEPTETRQAEEEEEKQMTPKPQWGRKQWARTHYGFVPNRSRLLSTVSMGRSMNGDRLDVLLDQILDSYRRIGEKNRSPVLRASSVRDARTNMALFVNHAVDNFMAREASMSLVESRSNLSVLTTGFDRNFQNPPSFLSRSEIPVDDDYESEKLFKPDFVAVMPVFDHNSTGRDVSVSAPFMLDCDRLPPEEGGKPDGASTTTRQALQRTGTNKTLVSFLPIPVDEETGACYYRSNTPMSLQSSMVPVQNANDSWCTVAEPSSGGVSVTEVPDGNPRTVPAEKSEDELKLQRLISTEELKRCVLVSVECRLRMYICKLKKNEPSSSRRISASSGESATEEHEKSSHSGASTISGMNRTKYSPMVQNIIEFFDA